MGQVWNALRLRLPAQRSLRIDRILEGRRDDHALLAVKSWRGIEVAVLDAMFALLERRDVLII